MHVLYDLIYKFYLFVLRRACLSLVQTNQIGLVCSKLKIYLRQEWKPSSSKCSLTESVLVSTTKNNTNKIHIIRHKIQLHFSKPRILTKVTFCFSVPPNLPCPIKKKLPRVILRQSDAPIPFSLNRNLSFMSHEQHHWPCDKK